MIDRIIIRNCIRGERSAQKQFYSNHVEALKKTSRRYTRNSADAKDVLQNAFVRIFNNLSKADLRKESLLPWMRRIVINEALRLKKLPHIERVEDHANYQYLSIHMEQSLNSLEVQDLHMIISQLPYVYRVVFQLKEIEGYNHKEISIALKIEPSTSRSLLFRAKKKLKELVNKHYSIKQDNI